MKYREKCLWKEQENIYVYFLPWPTSHLTSPPRSTPQPLMRGGGPPTPAPTNAGSPESTPRNPCKHTRAFDPTPCPEAGCSRGGAAAKQLSKPSTHAIEGGADPFQLIQAQSGCFAHCLSTIVAIHVQLRAAVGEREEGACQPDATKARARVSTCTALYASLAQPPPPPARRNGRSRTPRAAAACRWYATQRPCSARVPTTN